MLGAADWPILISLLFLAHPYDTLHTVGEVDSRKKALRAPQPLLPQTLPEWLLEFGAAAALLGQFLVVLAAWPEIPDQVPQHFDAAGQTDAWGSKATLLLLPAVNFVVFVMMTVISRFPHISSVPVEVTPLNAQRVYRLIRFQTIWLKAVVALVLAYMSWRTIEQARGGAQGLGAGFLPLTILAVGSAVAWFYFELRRRGGPAGEAHLTR
jgi:hypothetical protein